MLDADLRRFAQGRLPAVEGAPGSHVSGDRGVVCRAPLTWRVVPFCHCHAGHRGPEGLMAPRIPGRLPASLGASFAAHRHHEPGEGCAAWMRFCEGMLRDDWENVVCSPWLSLCPFGTLASGSLSKRGAGVGTDPTLCWAQPGKGGTLMQNPSAAPMAHEYLSLFPTGWINGSFLFIPVGKSYSPCIRFRAASWCRPSPCNSPAREHWSSLEIS